jgi:hypothetical protein
MEFPNWWHAQEIHPSEIRVGDTIGTVEPSNHPYRVKMISTRQESPRLWTFFGRDDNGSQHTGTFAEGEFVRRYAKTA